MIPGEAQPRNLIRETHLGQKRGKEKKKKALDVDLTPWTRERGQQGEFVSSNTLRYKSISREISWNWVRLLEVRSDCLWCEVLTVTHATKRQP